MKPVLTVEKTVAMSVKQNSTASTEKLNVKTTEDMKKKKILPTENRITGVGLGRIIRPVALIIYRSINWNEDTKPYRLLRVPIVVHNLAKSTSLFIAFMVNIILE